jgi:hypothetical protein
MLWAVLFRLRRAGFDADGVGDASQVAGVTGDNGGLVAHGGGDDDGIDDVSGAGGREAMPAARPVAWSSGMMSQPLSTRTSGALACLPKGCGLLLTP